ncbi:SERTA domain-containing protein 3 [Trichomycterus rosablanca]|uniref:SERTA domain-containing protein 3 n=1 Tax=Trichomycterus rosablanca TaxID=2290929 RepID=UPI002F356665
MVARGLKRKLHNDVGEPVWENQLQSVLNISIDKFQRDQSLVEPSLLRSVLITNTLRNAKTHMEACSENQNPAKKPQTYQPVHTNPAGFESDAEEDPTEDFSLSTTISAILEDLDTALDSTCGPSGPQRAPLASVENLSVDRTCKMSPVKIQNCSFNPSNHLQDMVIDGLLLDVDAAVREVEANDHAFSFPAEELVKYLPYMCTT